jgi:redox-sensitive bicupin YhaK (pirin superfamily)
MATQRRIHRIVTVPPLAPGFLGRGHLSAPVVTSDDFSRTDPFILLMDDRLDMGSRLIDAPHPHAGFETITLLLEGSVDDQDEGGELAAGDVQWMTAGSGVIHGETLRVNGKVRLLQLWLTLPVAERWTPPALRILRRDTVPVHQEAGTRVRIYSGASGKSRSRTPNHVPLLMLDLDLAPGAAFEQIVPGRHNGFVFVVAGAATVGANEASLAAGQVGWLDRPGGEDGSALGMRAGAPGARLLLYAGEPQGEPIVSQGPFIGGSEEDIRRLIAEYRSGAFVRISTLSPSSPSPED